MTIFNLGSINIDNFYRVLKLPEPGETIAALEVSAGLGGKGANQSIASARAGGDVVHIGMVGADGAWCKDRLADNGINVEHVAQSSEMTGHANIVVDANGENSIVLFQGANVDQSLEAVERALRSSQEGDILILQNETDLVFEAARIARGLGLRVLYSAAPFDVEIARKMLPLVDVLILNEIEAEQLCEALHVTLSELEVPSILVTKGGNGVLWQERETGENFTAPAHNVEVVDTTGAGDCFTGYFTAALDRDASPQQAIKLASAAAALQVTRLGTGDVIPRLAEVEAFLAAE